MEEILIPDDVKKDVSVLYEWSSTISVRNVAERKAVYEAVKEVKQKRNRIMEFFAASKSAAANAHRAICANEKQFTDKLDAFEKAGKNAIIVFDRIEEAKRINEQRRLQAIADEEARKERERLEKAAMKLKSPELKEERLSQACSVVAPVINIPQSAPKQEGESYREIWKWRVVDFSKVPDNYKVLNEVMLNKLATLSKGNIPVLGIEFYSEKSLAIRT